MHKSLLSSVGLIFAKKDKAMAFIKGQSGNPKGREKGSKNRATTELRDFFRDLLEQNREQIVEDLAAIDPLSRLRIIVELSSFVLPRLATVQADVNANVEQHLSLYNRLDELSVVPDERAIESPDDAALLGEGEECDE